MEEGLTMTDHVNQEYIQPQKESSFYADQDYKKYSNDGNINRGNSSEQQDWRAILPTDLQKSMQRFNSPESLAKAYNDAMTLISKKVIDYSHQDWRAYHNIQSQFSGIPVNPSEYEFDRKPSSGEKIDTFTDEDIEKLKNISHSLELNKEQARKFYTVLNDWGNNILSTHRNVIEQRDAANIKELKKDWGSAYKEKVEIAEKCVENILPEITGVNSKKIKEEIINNGMQNNAVLLKILSAIGELGMEGSSGGYANVNHIDAEHKLDQMKMDPNVAMICNE